MRHPAEAAQQNLRESRDADPHVIERGSETPTFEEHLLQYISTRGGGEPKTYSEALLEGLAVDGGLLVPERLPQSTRRRSSHGGGLGYAELATEVLGAVRHRHPARRPRSTVRGGYSPPTSSRRRCRSPPIGGGITLVGLSEGPTLAFKDMAMQFLGQALEYALERTGGVLNIVGATSGDTGSAAEHALHGKERISVFMLSPPQGG